LEDNLSLHPNCRDLLKGAVASRAAEPPQKIVRKSSEMRLANLSGAGEAIGELGLA
jgi:hypothetical protein